MFEHSGLLLALLFGAVVSSDFLAGVLTSFRALFANDFSGAQAFQGWGELAAQMDSNGEFNTYNWFGTTPKMSDVTNDTVPIGGLESYNFSIRNREYQAAIEVDRMTFERDQLNLVTPRITGLADEAARHPSELIFQLQEANPLAYDGVAFFADTRAFGSSGNIDNLLAGTGITIAQIQADLASARATMRLFKDDKGRPLNSIGNIIVVPAGLEQVFWQALNPGGGLLDRAPLPNTDTGTFKGAGYTVVVNPYLTDVTDWYLYTSKGPTMRPFILQTEKKPVLESDTNPQSRENIIRRKYLYSVYGRYAVGVTDPRLGIKMVNAG